MLVDIAPEVYKPYVTTNKKGEKVNFCEEFPFFFTDMITAKDKIKQSKSQKVKGSDLNSPFTLLKSDM